MKKEPKKSNKFTNPKTNKILITEIFNEDLAKLLALKIEKKYSKFESKKFINKVKKEIKGKRYTERVEVMADSLYKYLPNKFQKATNVLMKILGPENPNETGMFTHYYWILPIAKFIEKYGLDDFKTSVEAIEEITKRNTGEYAIRSFAVKYPVKILSICRRWAKSPNFHLRRLASEGLRPKLPWAPKLYLWKENPKPVFEILEILKEDEIKFVKKSVANHLRDWLKVNPKEAKKVIQAWSKSKNENTKWIVNYTLR